jgi:hypothetical protein
MAGASLDEEKARQDAVSEALCAAFEIPRAGAMRFAYYPYVVAHLEDSAKQLTCCRPAPSWGAVWLSSLLSKRRISQRASAIAYFWMRASKLSRSTLRGFQRRGFPRRCISFAYCTRRSCSSIDTPAGSACDDRSLRACTNSFCPLIPAGRKPRTQGSERRPRIPAFAGETGDQENTRCWSCKSPRCQQAECA